MGDQLFEEHGRLLAERDRLLRELEDVRVRLGGAPDSRLDGENGLAAATMRDRDRLASMEEIARKFHDVAAKERDLARAQLATVSMERDLIRAELEARVAKVEAERDEARAQVSELLPEADAKQHFATRALRAEERLEALRIDLHRLLSAFPSRFDFASFHEEKTKWSLDTFGPGDRYAGVVEHIRRELKEIEAQPSDLSEWVDVILLAMDGAWRSAGANGTQLVEALLTKQEKNRARRWPDWRTLQPGQVSQHVKDESEEK